MGGNPSDGASTGASASSMPAPSFGRAPPQPTPTRGVPRDGGDVASGSAEPAATQKGGKGKGKASQAGSSKGNGKKGSQTKSGGSQVKESGDSLEKDWSKQFDILLSFGKKK